MGNSVSRTRLRPADEVDEAPYELRSLRLEHQHFSP